METENLNVLSLDAYLFAPHVLRMSVQVWTSKDFDVDLLKALSLVSEEPGSRVEALLSGSIMGCNVTYVSNPSRRPAVIGFLITESRSTVLVTFKVWRGAIGTKGLADEIREAVKIECNNF